MKEGIVLFAHGSRDPEWAQPFERLAASLAKKARGPVGLAYLELMKPSLDEVIASMASQGMERIRIVPVFLGQGSHVKDDLPRLIQAARDRHCTVKLELEVAIGEQPRVIEAIADVIAKKAARASP